LVEKMKITEKEARNGPFLKQQQSNYGFCRRRLCFFILLFSIDFNNNDVLKK